MTDNLDPILLRDFYQDLDYIHFDRIFNYSVVVGVPDEVRLQWKQLMWSKGLFVSEQPSTISSGTDLRFAYPEFVKNYEDADGDRVYE